MDSDEPAWRALGGNVPSGAGLVMKIHGKGTPAGGLSRRARGRIYKPGPWRRAARPAGAVSRTARRIVPHGRDGVVLREPMLSGALLPYGKRKRSL